MANPTTVSWTDPTTNTDDTPVIAGEITGYQVGIRSTTSAGSVAGTYPVNVTVAADQTSAALPKLLPDTYVAAARAVGGQNSAWSAESDVFTMAPSIPNPPSAVSVK